MPEVNSENVERKSVETQSDGGNFAESLKEDSNGKKFADFLKDETGAGKDFAESLKENSENKESTIDRQLPHIRDIVNNIMIDNKKDGLRREDEVENELKEKYPESEGYKIEKEVYLRDKDGNIVRDPVTGEARRIDFVVIKDGKVAASIEVTSKTADKTDQSAKEARIREAGGNYIKDSDGHFVEIPPTVTTIIERRN